MITFSEFEKERQKAKNTIFRLESVPEYKLKGDLDNFQKFKEGKSYIGQEERIWFKKLRESKQKGILMQRIRVIKLPFSDYLKYEINFWKNSIKYGEQILFIDKFAYKKITANVNFMPEDFWLFDDKTLIIFHYTQAGEWKNEEKVNDARLIDKYIKLKENLLKHSVSIFDYLDNL